MLPPILGSPEAAHEGGFGVGSSVCTICELFGSTYSEIRRQLVPAENPQKRTLPDLKHRPFLRRESNATPGT